MKTDRRKTIGTDLKLLFNELNSGKNKMGIANQLNKPIRSE